ncbi:MAG TPA: hypothetical protein VE377_00130 [Candidatus Dormibacteraeota bacterium]|nr:hypothetical protein [Candidatus Dormibacteraeota bacterium]
MNTDYVLACGVVWRRTGDPEAGWDLVDGLKSRDPEVRVLAQTLLVENGESSMGLLERALSVGIVDPDEAGPCMAEILRVRHAKPVTGQRILRHCGDAPLRREMTHSN